MTKQNDLKKLVRKRMENTGERYAAARRNVRDEVAPASSIRRPIKGWQLDGATPQAYEAFADRSADDATCARAQCRPDHVPQWTTLSQQFFAGEYRGARLRYSARIRTAGRDTEAKLWMRLDENNAMLLLNYSVTIAGDEDFRPCEIVLDIDEETTLISFGMIVSGMGAAWLRDVSIERVGRAVAPTASRHIQSHPSNLDFGE